MGHKPYDQILTTPEQRARGIIDLVLRLEDHIRCQELDVIAALAMTFLEDRRAIYAEMPININGFSPNYTKPVEFREWVFDALHR